MLDEQEFRRCADDALAALNRGLIEASDDYEFEVDFNAGALTVEFDDPPAKFVISPNSPVRQIWVSANSRSYKLDWDAAQNSFVHVDSGDSLSELVEKAIGRHLGVEISL
jgi:iron donor protein CyaY